jgi:hypothetical protein
MRMREICGREHRCYQMVAAVEELSKLFAKSARVSGGIFAR